MSKYKKSARSPFHRKKLRSILYYTEPTCLGFLFCFRITTATAINLADVPRLPNLLRWTADHCSRGRWLTETETPLRRGKNCGAARAATVSGTPWWTSTRERISANGNAANPDDPVRLPPASIGCGYRTAARRRSYTPLTRSPVTRRPSHTKASNVTRRGRHRGCPQSSGTTRSPPKRLPNKLL